VKVFVDDIDKITLEVFTIGYTEKGESQVVLLYDNLNSRCILSFVIDCFSVNETNLTIDILNQYNIKHLDYFIWTHTDEDHSIGINKIIDTFCNKKTQFYLPEGVSGNEDDFIYYNQEVKECFAKINSFNKGTNYNVHSLTSIVNGNTQVLKMFFADSKTPKEFQFEIIAIAPISALIRRRWDSGEVKKKNDLSIATIFKVGEIGLLFSGDIENQTINQIPDFHFEGLSYIKTPHHTSKSSAKLLDKIEKVFNYEKILSAVSTTYKSNNLPDIDLIEQYKKYVNTFSSTGDGSFGYGYIKTVFEIMNKEFTEELFGDAVNH
jgi:beta-lactamase superfamily II metal-dependent hydrolase